MSPFSITSLGMSRLLKGLMEIPKEVVSELDKALYAEAAAIFRKSQRIVPVDRTYLKQSGTIEGPTNNEVLISYGGTATPYAMIVHERIMSPSGKKIEYSRPGKSAKYLEKPFMDAIPGMEERLAKIVEGAAEGKKAGAPAIDNSTPSDSTGSES